MIVRMHEYLARTHYSASRIPQGSSQKQKGFGWRVGGSSQEVKAHPVSGPDPALLIRGRSVLCFESAKTS